MKALLLLLGTGAAAFVLHIVGRQVWYSVDQRGLMKPCAGGWWESELVYGCDVHRMPAGGPNQPVNAYSNLAFLVAGWAVYLWLDPTPEGLVFAVAMTLLCVGSYLYHAAEAARTAALDHAGMFAVFTALATHNVAQGELPILWLGMAIAAAAAGYFFRYAFRLHVVPLMGLFLWLSMFGADDRTLMWASVAAFVAAMAAWQLGKRRRLVGRWGHGAWHVLSAAAIALMYLAG